MGDHRNILLALAYFALALPVMAQAEGTPITDLPPGFYPGGGFGTPTPADDVNAYIARHRQRITEITTDVQGVRAGAIRGGCIGQTLDICIASLAQAFILTTDATPAQYKDQVLDPPELDVNGKALFRAPNLWAYDPLHPAPRPMLIGLEMSGDKVVSVMFTLNTRPERARTEAEYDATGVYELASSLVDPSCLGPKLTFYRFLENGVKPNIKVSRDIETGPGSAKDFYHAHGEAAECGYSIGLASEVGVDTESINEDNGSGTTSGAHLSFSASGIPQTPDYQKLFAQVSTFSPRSAGNPGGRPPLGLAVSDPPGISRMMLGYKGGALVFGIKHGSVAEAAGIHWADVLLTFDGQPIPSGTSLAAMVENVRPGQKVEITLYRNRQKLTVEAQF